jgi:hypothetical protein
MTTVRKRKHAHGLNISLATSANVMIRVKVCNKKVIGFNVLIKNQADINFNLSKILPPERMIE